ncbi:MAG: [protein-PII] uridylyltransferase [Pseudomonadales bacterium]|nr:[protein-PII] uridylyltransferase [Pseudomonadales bacterium]
MSEPTSLSSIQAEIFNNEKFTRQLAESVSPIATFKEVLKNSQSILDQHFRNDTPTRLLVFARAWLVDQLLTHAWRQFSFRQNDIGLIAVGGYGRGELHPHSDIDILILYRGFRFKSQHKHIEKFVTLLWDIGLKVGHSVRSTRQCIDQARNDITIVTSLMESRLLVGSQELFAHMQKRVGPKKIWSAKAFYAAKRDEQIFRHRKFDDTEHNLEPNVKESPGGLRDLQMIGWVAKRHFGGDNLRDLVTNHFLTEAEFGLLSEGQNYLWKIRYGLHMLAGRAEDRLLFDYQERLAKLFGFKDTEESLAIEQLMQKYYRVALRILELNDMLLQHFDEAILRADESFISRPLNTRFKITNDYIEVVDNQVFQRTPFALMEIFLLMAQNREIQGVRASTIRLIREHRHLIDHEFRQDIRNISIFMELPRSPDGIVTQLQRMRRYAVLGRYLPEFGRIIGKMQYDLFHIYTVDAHTLLLLQYLRRIYLGSEAERFPLSANVIRQIPKLELLYIAGLYHDIAKGRGGDHSSLGAEDARAFCERHRLSAWDTELVSWLVENHLIMSITAQRMDISDPSVVQQFAERMQDQLHLDYLFVLTVADINATNTKLWNSWRASLLHDLYLETRRALSRGLENPIDREIEISTKQDKALALLPFNPTIVTALWQQLGDDYFIQHSDEDIAWHTQAILEHTEPGKPLVMIKDVSTQHHASGTQIFIYSQTGYHLFATTAAILEQLELNIVDARISTSPNNFNLNSYIVLTENGQPLGENPSLRELIKQTLTQALLTPQEYPTIIKRHTPRRLQHFTMPTQVNIFSDNHQPYTVVEVVTPDRPGLLARIGRIFLENSVVLQKAKIATLGERVEDVFFITTKNNEPIADNELCEKLKMAICSQLDQWAQLPPNHQATTTL